MAGASCLELGEPHQPKGCLLQGDVLAAMCYSCCYTGCTNPKNLHRQGQSILTPSEMAARLDFLWPCMSGARPNVCRSRQAGRC